MKILEPPDTFHFSAAIGWLELGNELEARDELEKISTELRGHPDVLELEWTLAAAAEEWREAVETATTLIRLAPERAFGWIHRSFSLHELGLTEEAWETLLPAAQLFPAEFLIPYNLSCYAAQMGKLDQARYWLQRAIELGGVERVKTMALDDGDLAPLLPEIKKL